MARPEDEMSSPPVALPLPRPPQRVRLAQALTDRDAGLAEIYEAAVTLIERGDFPDCLGLAAHSMRELMEKLPRVLDVPSGQDFSARNRLDRLGAALEKARASSACAVTDGGWSGEIDEPLRNVIGEVEEIVADRASNALSRKQSTEEMFRRLEPGFIPRTPRMTATDLKAWDGSQKYFENVAHHQHLYRDRATDMDELTQHVQVVEVMILEKMRPATADDYDEIDQLMDVLRAARDD